SVLSCNAPDLELRPSLIARILAPFIGIENAPFLVPFGLADPACLPDTAKLRQEAEREGLVESLLLHLDNIVRLNVGKAMCGASSPESTMRVRSRNGPPRFGMHLSAAKRELRTFLGSKWGDEKFEEMWGFVLQRISDPSSSQRGSEAVSAPVCPISSIVGESGNRLLVSVNPPSMSMTCRAQLAFIDLTKARWMELSLSGILIAVCLAGYFSYKASVRDAHVVSVLIDDILYSVHEETNQNLNDPARHPVPGLIILQLRDYLLNVAVSSTKPASDSSIDGLFPSRPDNVGRTIWTLPDASTRDAIWARCATLVQRNSCVREIQMDYKGKRHPTWQWIGSPALSPKPRHSPPSSSSVSTPLKGGASMFSEFPATPERPSAPSTMPVTSSLGMAYAWKAPATSLDLLGRAGTSGGEFTFGVKAPSEKPQMSDESGAAAVVEGVSARSLLYPSLDDLED
ncbi:inner nuclear membrane protein enriched at telomere/subtelomere region, partial [Dinochytrium kinnereticum]